VSGSVEVEEGRTRELHGSRATAAMGCRGGSSPTAKGWGGWVREVQWEVGGIAGEAVAAAEGRRGDLHGAGPAAMAPAAR
jgi:hypothetical protein